MDASKLKAATQKVTKKWAKQRKSEERDARSRSRRRSVLCREVRVTDKAVTFANLEEVYNIVSGGGKYVAMARQLYYRIRPIVESATGKPLCYRWFSQGVLPQYLEQHNRQWKIAYDARGSFEEPHTGLVIPCGTIEVDAHLRKIVEHESNDDDVELPKFDLKFPTMGPQHRYSALVFFEKQGFAPLLKASKIAERYDVAIMSTKGQSVTASRKLIDSICGRYDIPLLIFHDFDKAGLNIAQTVIGEASGKVRYHFRHDIESHDCGLRLADVEKWELPPEPCAFKGKFPWNTQATEEERNYLRAGQRVELNAFTSGDFITWIEGKLEEHGIHKVIPDDETLEVAYRRAYHTALLNRAIGAANDEAKRQAEDAELPPGLTKEIIDELEDKPETPWDHVVARCADLIVNPPNEDQPKSKKQNPPDGEKA